MHMLAGTYKLLKGIPNFKNQFFSKQTQIAHLCHTKGCAMIKQIEVKIWADQVYLGQTVSSYPLLGFLFVKDCVPMKWMGDSNVAHNS